MNKFIHSALRVLEIEAKAISDLSNRLNDGFVHACNAIMDCVDNNGRIIVMGIGKSGHIGKKIAATLASTGTPAFFVHPAEAAHGDLGMVTASDLVILISKSGETQEIITFLPMLKRLGVKIISLIGRLDSTIGSACDINLDVSVTREACGLNLAPTASSTATLAMGDALAVSILEARGFNENDFARQHPGGLLGRQLLTRVRDVMLTGDAIPRVLPNADITEVILETTKKRLGMTTIVDQQQSHKVLGIFTDGDLRRLFAKHAAFDKIVIQDVMMNNFKSVNPDMLASECILIMQNNKINALPVIDEDGNLVGALNIHDLFKAGIV